MDGWWEDAGWEPSGPPAMDQIGPRTHTILNPGEGSQRAQLRAMWRRIGNWYRQRDGGKQETFDEASNICVIGDTFSSEVDVADGPSQDDCERWLAERAGLDSERRALVGSSLDLYEDQLEWAEGQTRQDCEDAQRSAEFWSESAAKQAEIAALSGDGTAADMAVEATKRSEEYARKAERDCDWADKVGDKRQEIADRVDNRPERLEEIEAEKAELDAKIAECDLIE